jgi:FtsZ-binding cell division protein ZapB
MKVKEKKEDFAPFTIEITFENQAEVEALYYSLQDGNHIWQDKITSLLREEMKKHIAG